MSFTPGPWVVEETAVGTVETESGIAIAQAFQVKPLRQDLKQEERQANARLIAASPSMLAALKVALAMIIAECADGEHTDEAHQIKHAIELATGEPA